MKTSFLLCCSKRFVLIACLTMLFCTTSSYKRPQITISQANKPLTSLKIIMKSPDAQMLVQEEDSITFYWDPPAYDPDLSHYELFFHRESDSLWTPLKSNIPTSEKPKIVVHRNEIPYPDSLFYFGIQSVDSGGLRSDIYSSSDPATDPKGCWRLIWELSK
jgi:hypothetical protein